MSLDLQALLAEIQNINLGGENADQVQAQITASLKPLTDRLDALEGVTKDIQQEIADNTNGVKDADTALKAIADKLAGIQTPVSVPAADGQTT